MILYKVILFGTGAQFSVAVLGNLLSHGLVPVALVLPQFAPSESKGLHELPVDVAGKENRFVTQAKRLSIPLIYLPEPSQSLRADKLDAFDADFLLLACWPYLLSPEIVNTAGKAALNLHPSLLPNYRGADPVAEQIHRQEKKLGVSLHLLSQAFDKGDIIGQAELEFDAKFPGRDLIEARAAEIGTGLFIELIQCYGGPEWRPRAQ